MLINIINTQYICNKLYKGGIVVTLNAYIKELQKLQEDGYGEYTAVNQYGEENGQPFVVKEDKKGVVIKFNLQSLKGVNLLWQK